MMIHNDIDKFISIRPAAYRFLKAIKFVRDVSINGCTNYEAEIVLTKISGGEIEDMKIRFTNVVDVKLGQIESMFGMMLSIEDVSSRQLEGVTFHISEDENCTFSFGCSDFYIEVADRQMT